MKPTVKQLSERLDAIEMELEAHRAYIKAIEYALRVLVLAHPKPQRLSETWMGLLPSIAAKHRDSDGDLFAAAFQQALVVLTEQIGEHPPRDQAARA
ncbi:hypothetical protein JAK53_10650 [Stenotrophomonas maltophilia]|uniref:hypothetical protein n=1 Tax=Stenotrophomonas TaxID=40323 RepID=UPI0018D37528|nr:hypothetical protein [Stenotrophomonas maltophilia]MBH1816800.1 hypothetical protein [Stenotrophomonas maltophilia]MCU1029739.1 hypothetical protein [Stenotrophomonas maltophilia]